MTDACDERKLNKNVDTLKMPWKSMKDGISLKWQQHQFKEIWEKKHEGVHDLVISKLFVLFYFILYF